MMIPSKPNGMHRREFLQYTAGGLLLSGLATGTLWGVAREAVTFTFAGFSLELETPHGGVAALRSLRNPKTNFESVSYTHLPSPRDGLLSRMPSSA